MAKRIKKCTQCEVDLPGAAFAYRGLLMCRKCYDTVKESLNEGIRPPLNMADGFSGRK